MRTAKTLIRLGRCPGWSEYSLGAHAILLVLSCCGSNWKLSMPVHHYRACFSMGANLEMYFLVCCLLTDPLFYPQTIFSSPEPNAHRWAYSIRRRPSVNIFKRLLWIREADSFHILHIASIGGGNKDLCFLFQSDKNCGCFIMGKVEIGNFCCLTADI